jgi:hypothetical protein
MSIATRLAAFSKWTEIHGCDPDESQEIIDSMKKKNYLYYDDDPYDDRSDIDDQEESTVIKDIDYIKWLFEDCPYQYEIGIITKSYVYHDRLFGIKQFGLEKLQRKWREYSKKKLDFKKSIKNLRYRQIYGKYPYFD